MIIFLNARPPFYQIFFPRCDACVHCKFTVSFYRFQCVFAVWCEKTVEYVGCVAAQEPSTWTLCSIFLAYIQCISFQLLFRSENRSIEVWTQFCHRIKRKTETHYTVTVWCLCAWKAQWQKNSWIENIFAAVLGVKSVLISAHHTSARVVKFFLGIFLIKLFENWHHSMHKN